MFGVWFDTVPLRMRSRHKSVRALIIPPGVSLPVTVMYRVVNTVIQLPPGYYLYQQTLRRNEQPPGAPGAV